MTLSTTFQPPRRVAVGSTNKAKVGSVQTILAQLSPTCAVVSLDVPSGVPAQPVGAAETLRGATNRALAALQTTDADWGVGLEGGVEFDASGCWVINQAVIISREGRKGHAQGLRMLLPPQVALRLKDGLELGDAIDELAGEADTKQHAGALGILSNGLVNRRQMWESAFAAALPTLLHPELYPDTAPTEPTLTRDFTVACFVLHAGQVLLLWHRKLQMYLPPGGHIDPHELPDDAAVREVLEETGLQVEMMSPPHFTGIQGVRPLARPEGVQVEFISPGHEHIDLVYYARVKPGASADLVPNLAETGGAAWYGPAQLKSLRLTEEIIAWCERALAAAAGWEN